MSDVCRCVDSSAIITPNMSRHMKKLRDVGLVHTYKQGRSHYCQPNTTLLNECAAYFTSLAREI